MKWKEIYDKCNNKKFSLITDIQQPVILKSNFANFLDKYKWGLLIGIIALIVFLIITLNFNIKILLCFLVIAVFLIISLIYYNTFKLIIKDDKLMINIMFREITLKREDLITIYIEKQKSRVLLVIPIFLYSINILYKDKENVNGYSLSTIMLKKKDVLKFFNHFKFNVLEKQQEEDKKQEAYNKVIKLFSIFATLIVIIAILIFAYFNH